MTQSEDAEQNRLNKAEFFNTYMPVHFPQTSTVSVLSLIQKYIVEFYVQLLCESEMTFFRLFAKWV